MRSSRRGAWSWLAHLALLAACACGGGDGLVDGGSDAPPDAQTVIAPPDIPWLDEGVPPIALTPCPTGWREVTVSGVTACDPYPEGGAKKCPFGEAHFPGEPGCTPIGTPCPAGDYADALPTETPVVYVNASAAPGGDGTRTTPYASLAEVPWISLPTGATVALAKGTYEGTIALEPATRVVGACVAETMLTGFAIPVPAVVAVRSAGEPAFVSNLAIVGPPQWGALVRDGQSLELEGVLIDRASDTGVLVTDAKSFLRAHSLVVRGTAPNDIGLFGRGIELAYGGRLEASRLIVEDSREIGLMIVGEVVLTDAVVRGTREQASDGMFGRGIGLQDGARFEASRLLVDDNRAYGLFAATSEVVLTDTVVRGTREQASDGTTGRGISIQDGAHLEANRLLVDDNRELGVFARASEVVLADAIVRGTRERPSDETNGRGIGIQESSHFEASRVLVEDNREVGLYVSTSSEAVLTDAVVRGTREQAMDGKAGVGIGLGRNARLEASRVLVEDNRDVGLVADSSELVLSDIVVRGTRERAGDLAFGSGLIGQVNSRVSGTRVVVDGAREGGIVAVLGTTIELTDVNVASIETSASADPARTFGHAVITVDAALRLTRFHVRDAATCGIFFAAEVTLAPPSVDLSSGLVERTAIGACVQVDGYDLSRLTEDVQYRDNGVNLDSTSLPVPQLADSLEP